MTREPAIAGLSRPELQGLAKRLREARNRARDIASQQRREMRGKSAPRGATPAADNLGTLGKIEVIDIALQRIGKQLRIVREAAGGAKTVANPKRPDGATAKPKRAGPAATMAKAETKPGSGPKLRTDPREVGRVSQAGKVAQARRDAKKV